MNPDYEPTPYEQARQAYNRRVAQRTAEYTQPPREDPITVADGFLRTLDEIRNLPETEDHGS